MKDESLFKKSFPCSMRPQGREIVRTWLFYTMLKSKLLLNSKPFKEVWITGLGMDEHGVSFRWKDYRAKGRERQKVMTLASDEFIRRFLIHVLPSGFHRIRHYGLFANGGRAENLARTRGLLGVPAPQHEPDDADDDADEPPMHSFPCPCCGGRMIIIETFERGATPRARPTNPIRIDTS
jgi:hypothetical protein